MSHDLTEEQFEEKVIETSDTEKVVVDFWAPWCAPCQSLAPRLEKACEEQELALYKVNVDDNPELASTYGVRGIPAVKIFHNGEIVDEFTGVQPPDKIRNFLQ